VSGVLLAKVFNRQAYEVARYREENTRQVDLQVRQAMSGQSFFAVVPATSSGPLTSIEASVQADQNPVALRSARSRTSRPRHPAVPASTLREARRAGRPARSG
jgi:hypothetical protein